jgi:hypothetical protein
MDLRFPDEDLDQKAAPPPDPWAGERTITEFWSIGRSNAWHQTASAIPFGLGAFLFFGIYLLNAVAFWNILRYRLTNRRIIVERGITKKTSEFVALDEIDELRITNEQSFTRTGDIEIVCDDKVKLTMTAIQTPWPSRQTILDAMLARKEIDSIRRRQTELAVK